MFENIYASPPFKFIVGGNAYYIHSDLVASHSAPLGRIINGEMAEAQRGFAVLDDVDEETIKRFIEWAYKGYYTAACFRKETLNSTATKDDVYAWVFSSQNKEIPNKGKTKATEQSIVNLGWQSPSMPATEPPIAEDLPEPWDGHVYPRRSKDKKRAKVQDIPQLWDDPKTSPSTEKDAHQVLKSRELKESFLKYDYKVRRDKITIPPTRGNRGPSEDYTNVFLSHTRLYVFAEMYDIQILKMLALEELHSTLANFTLYESRTGDIVALLRYVYANTSGEEGGDDDGQLGTEEEGDDGGGPPGAEKGDGSGGGGGRPRTKERKRSGGGGGELRKLVADYMCCEMGLLIKDRRFKDLMFEDGGDLLGDFMKVVALRID